LQRALLLLVTLFLFWGIAAVVVIAYNIDTRSNIFLDSLLLISLLATDILSIKQVSRHSTFDNGVIVSVFVVLFVVLRSMPWASTGIENRKTIVKQEVKQEDSASAMESSTIPSSSHLSEEDDLILFLEEEALYAPSLVDSAPDVVPPSDEEVEADELHSSLQRKWARTVELRLMSFFVVMHQVVV
jgi:hypothetical protein